jgi:hypothetical protein
VASAGILALVLTYPIVWQMPPFLSRSEDLHGATPKAELSFYPSQIARYDIIQSRGGKGRYENNNRIGS